MLRKAPDHCRAYENQNREIIATAHINLNGPIACKPRKVLEITALRLFSLRVRLYNLPPITNIAEESNVQTAYLVRNARCTVV